MPWDTIEQVPEQLRQHQGVTLTLEQANKWAEIYDAIAAKHGGVNEPAAAAWAAWERIYKKDGDAWVQLKAGDEQHNCVCLKCGHELQTAEHCEGMACPSCGGEMRRQDRPGQGKEISGSTAQGQRRMQSSPFGGMRALQLPLSPSKGVIVEDYNGGKVIRNAVLLKEGSWRDSGQMTTLRYSAKTLERFANNWVRTDLWDVHMGNTPRPITAKVGEVLNPRYNKEARALVGDLFFHMQTSRSVDTFNLAEAGIRGIINPVAYSMEHKGEEAWSTDLGLFDAKTLEFYGGAICEKGASEGTKILSMSQDQDTDSAVMSSEKNPSPDTSGLKKLEVEEMTKEIEERLTALEGWKESIEAKAKELSDGLTNAMGSLKELSAKVADEATIKAMVSKELGAVNEQMAEVSKQTKELSAIVQKPRTLSAPVPVEDSDYVSDVIVDKTTGTVSGIE